MTESDEKRRFTRIPFSATAHIVNAMGSWYAPLVDISLKGALVEQAENWEGKIGDHYLIELNLDESESDIAIRMEVEVAHMENNHIGFSCQHIGLDSITHLRRLIELNLGDDRILDRELSALIESHNE